MIHPDNVDGCLKMLIFNHYVEDLAANTDIADQPIFIAPCDLKIKEVAIVPFGDDAGIDADNTSVWLFEKASTTLATKTYNAVTTFPDTNVKDTITLTTTTANLTVVKDTVVTFSITNGTAADLPPCLIQVRCEVLDQALFDSM
jgi:hypothetical protein